MQPAKKQSPVSALHEILTWSASRPDWQRDALRRIIVNGSIGKDDLKELERLCRAKHNADASNDPALIVVPLAATHLPPAPGAESSVSLVSIGNLTHVNRIPSDQVIPFGSAPGLTVIYGDNGSGKSGYARVIKKACRARGTAPIILPDVFAPAVSAKASAMIVFRTAGADIPVTWTDGVAPDPRLANVFVFDANSAGHYLHEDSAASFTPYGLDVLPLLSKTCDAIRDQLQQDINRIKVVIAGVAANWKYEAATAVGKLVTNLSATTKQADVGALSGLDAQQTARLKDLREALKSDPLQKAKETRASGSRLEVFATKVASAAKGLADETVENLRKLVEDAKATDEAAKSFTLSRFDSTYLGGTGNDLWRAMWEAAREFSVSNAYQGHTFPYTRNSARCLLCQQDLDEETSERLRSFEAFCNDKIQQAAAQAAKQLHEATETFAKLDYLIPDMEKLDADLMEMTPEQRISIVDFAQKTDERLEVIRTAIAERTWKIPCVLPASPETTIRGLCAILEIRAKIEELAHDPEVRKQFSTEHNELEAREWLARVKVEVLAQVDRHKQINKLIECQNDAGTKPITTKSTELTKRLVTNAFCEKFQIEAEALGLRTLDAKLEAIEGKKGETKFGLRLTSTTERKVHEIASEGEHRCVALAAFLAELSQASHNSALVDRSM
jgi:energy-coupling factor transporter ATP-binding protein EcfA2